MEARQDIKEEQIHVNNFLVNYKIVGIGQPVLILHGWGSSCNSWVRVQEALASKRYQVIIPDLPGFGKTAAPENVWGVEEYAEFVHDFVKEVGLGEFVLVGHSFGGQTAIQYITHYPESVIKLVLIAAAGIRHKPGFQVKAKMFVAHIMPRPVKNILSQILGKSDYGKAQGIMKDIMKKVIRQDLTAKISSVAVPTLIIWGNKDELTPVQDAYAMHKIIPNSTLEIIEGGKHALNFQAPEKVADLISSYSTEQ